MIKFMLKLFKGKSTSSKKEYKGLSDFLLHATPDEQKKVFTDAARRSNEDQKKIFTEASKMNKLLAN
jgi:hypothetical protein